MTSQKEKMAPPFTFTHQGDFEAIKKERHIGKGGRQIRLQK